MMEEIKEGGNESMVNTSMMSGSKANESPEKQSKSMAHLEGTPVQSLFKNQPLDPTPSASPHKNSTASIAETQSRQSEQKVPPLGPLPTPITDKEIIASVLSMNEPEATGHVDKSADNSIEKSAEKSEEEPKTEEVKEEEISPPEEVHEVNVEETE